MSKLEDKNRTRVKREHLQRILLNTIKVAGVVSLGLLAPNVLGAMKELGILPKIRQKEYISSSASKLTKRGLLKFDDGHYCLTLAGERVLRQWEWEDFKINKPKRWDKKWRVIVFDIPEKKRATRDRITSIFRTTGFRRLQNSVWVFPYDCEDLVGLMKTDFGVGKYLLYLIVDELENDKHLRIEFGLA